MVLVPSLLMVVSLAAPVPLSSVAVLGVEVTEGVDPQVARLLEDRIQGELVRAGVFARVVGTRDVGAVLSLEKTRQALDCDAAGCMSEIAGALGVDLVVSASVARLGQRSTFSMKLLEARSAVLKAAVQAGVAGGPEGLLAEVPGAVTRMLRDGGYSPPAADDAGGPAWRRPAGTGAAVAALAVGAGAVVAAVGLVLAGAVALVLPLLVYVPTPGLPGDVRVRALPGAAFALMGAGGIAALTAPAWVILGVAVVVAAWVIP